ncbi:MAG: TIGR00730 family Rossman fold protein [Chitinophagales bacterium]
MTKPKSICIFCGSAAGSDPIYVDQGFKLGQYIAENNMRLIYGGAKIGVMGAVASGVLEKGGEVIGIIPEFLCSSEIAHDQLAELIVVENMHQRKSLMHEMSDGFIALPGGFGTLEELFEVLTWAQLSLHQKPIGLLNSHGYYDYLTEFIGIMDKKKFLRKANKDLLVVSDSFEDLFLKFGFT